MFQRCTLALPVAFLAARGASTSGMSIAWPPTGDGVLHPTSGCSMTEKGSIHADETPRQAQQPRRRPQCVGSYLLGQRLGKGGTAAVYRARHVLDDPAPTVTGNVYDDNNQPIPYP